MAVRAQDELAAVFGVGPNIRGAMESVSTPLPTATSDGGEDDTPADAAPVEPVAASTIRHVPSSAVRVRMRAGNRGDRGMRSTGVPFRLSLRWAV